MDGCVVVTNLDPAYPLIRLGTGDLAVNVDPNPGVSCQQDRSIILAITADAPGLVDQRRWD
jgi:phenylacetate-CoA ligase